MRSQLKAGFHAYQMHAEAAHFEEHEQTALQRQREY
jgi:hypothetical protein